MVETVDLSSNPYTQMQINHYEHDATSWSPENRNPVVGSFDAHNSWPDYELLFRDLTREQMLNMDALDFACGPGRNLVKYSKQFRSLDGVDLAKANLEKAEIWLTKNFLPVPKLWLCNGVDLKNIPSDSYDFVMSTIALQHICVHEIRLSYFKEFFRVLRPGGVLSFQMGFGANRPGAVPYHANYYQAQGTNSHCDTTIENPDQPKADLESIGFSKYDFMIRPTGPGDSHQNWIFIRAVKEPAVQTISFVEPAE